MEGRELWFLERYFVVINAAHYGSVLWVLTYNFPYRNSRAKFGNQSLGSVWLTLFLIEIAVLNLVTKVSDPYGSIADLDTLLTSHY